MSLRLTILGASAAWTDRPCRPSSCYLVEIGSEGILLDLGQGALGSLFPHRDPSSLNAVVISHMHGDHHVDLIPLRNLLRYGYDEPRRVGLHAPAGLRHRYDVFSGEDGFLDILFGPDLVEGTRRTGRFDLRAQRVTHSGQSYAFRVSDTNDPDAPGLVYSGDCGRADELLPLIQEGDTVLCEAFWSTLEPIAGANHLAAADAADVARRGGAAHLILTHILEAHGPQAALHAAEGIFPGSVQLAEPELVIEIGPGR